MYGNLFDVYADSWDVAKSNKNVHIVFYENLKSVGIWNQNFVFVR